ncbi:Precorrin-6Y C(5,15)-methyltransferase [decarboxylating] [Rhodovastum atsumiense]|uniref:Precorrin-6y C5,15-methyltransferase (Decarboxylating) subunit CbiE n=1 Tax=Rhodovastum atsumiense TaxID=504468 RepID=A0A5M6IUA8_9PROT|nr:precorrin-6y C5,15-methyltransferase (decarboxylating) subunit CbiE [Rhodovastum atsumiense]KAA5611447.1 precorrin-6y C5,15-methyltransferase (decarboxylating) subunit CbiE [Rhodovastum atsumiense]CAH2601130.1 Precorrin-6Y C(5,15)-methyltransferase [decarboxylating] [Rhodovastum atsumiense]
MPAWLTVVGIGEDGPEGLGAEARGAIAAARVLVGGARHLAMVPPAAGQERLEWPRPFDVGAVLTRRGTPVCVLASGDPMLFGVGAVLARQVPAEEMRILPAPSAFSLAAARLGWPLQDVVPLSVTGRPLAAVLRHAYPGARWLVLAADGGTPAALAALLAAHGFGASRLEVLEHMGGAQERRHGGIAAEWTLPRCAELNVIAVECRADAAVTGWSGLAGLPDGAFRHDGQLTKRDVRAVTLAHLAPLPGELLWDVGAGCGSIGIEWMRSHPACRAIAIEANEARQALITHNREALGVPGLHLVAGRAPEALADLPVPQAVFIGGGLTVAGVVDRCWDALPPGGRLVANAVTLQSEAALVSWRERLGGDLTRLSVAHTTPVGRFDAWRCAMPVTVWSVRKPH